MNRWMQMMFIACLITTHTPAGGDEQVKCNKLVSKQKFQLTPRMGMNTSSASFLLSVGNYNPHPPYRDEQTIVVQVSVFVELQPASLHRDERNNLIKNQLYRIFSSHPRMGINDERQRSREFQGYFNPHPRMGMNATGLLKVRLPIYFNPHPRMGMNIKKN